MWLIGVAKEDITLVGSLLGKKLILTEFVAYIDLADMKAAGSFTDTKSIIMSVYMLCGFANFASIGIQIGGIGALAPGRRVLLARFGMRAFHKNSDLAGIENQWQDIANGPISSTVKGRRIRNAGNCSPSSSRK